MKWLAVFALASCGDNVASIDAAIAIDATPIDALSPCEIFELVSCLGSTARVTLESFDNCAVPMEIEHACTSTCDLDFDRMNLGKRTMVSVDPATLCAETPSAHLGSPCGVTSFCLPTRATIAGNGTVEQDYIACGEELCISRFPPFIANFGAACTATAYDEHSPSRDACFAGAKTEYCIGDWECPPGTLCNDSVASERPVCTSGS